MRELGYIMLVSSTEDLTFMLNFLNTLCAGTSHWLIRVPCDSVCFEGNLRKLGAGCGNLKVRLPHKMRSSLSAVGSLIAARTSVPAILFPVNSNSQATPFSCTVAKRSRRDQAKVRSTGSTPTKTTKIALTSDSAETLCPTNCFFQLRKTFTTKTIFRNRG